MMEYNVGDVVTLKFTGELLCVLRIGREQLLCRTKDCREIWFYPHELTSSELTESNSVKSGRFI